MRLVAEHDFFANIGRAAVPNRSPPCMPPAPWTVPPINREKSGRRRASRDGVTGHAEEDGFTV